MGPEEAQERARQRLADYEGDPALEPTDLDRLGDARVDAALLREWAVIEVAPDTLRSTRRVGAPVTALKRLMLRLLRQYTAELEARQTRFNLALLARLEALERRAAEGEGAGEREGGEAAGRGPAE
jgi:hypothetical protein